MPLPHRSAGRAPRAPPSGRAVPSRPTALLRLTSGTAAAFALAVWLGGSVARGDGDFGTRSLDAFSFGSRVSLSTPSSRLFQEQDEFVVHRTVLQSAGNQAGLIQAGVYRSGSGIQLDNCGTRSDYAVFTEVKPIGGMGYRCQLFSSVAPATVVTIDIFRFRAAGTWGIRINGGSAGSIHRLGFNRGAPAVGSEIEDLDNNHRTRTATRFGPVGHAGWSVYTAVGRTRPRPVTSRDSSFVYPPKDPFWRVPPPAARMTIRHR